MAGPLDLMKIALSGTHLIEASAGMGKTYTIASLFLRLLLEERIDVQAILVVTYTVPATDELKTRIRDRLRQARDTFMRGETEDAFLRGLLDRVENHAWAVSTLDFALSRFDETAISTIHGFCQRMLKELAFETASPFETELVTDQADLILAAADDFYRMRITAHSMPQFNAFCRGRKVSPEWFVNLAGQKNLSAEIIPAEAVPVSPEALEHQLEAYRRAFTDLAGIWPQARGEVEVLVCNKECINQSTHRISRVPGYLDEIECLLALGPALLPDAGCLARFTPPAMEKATKRGAVPEHRAFALCGALHRAAVALDEAMEAGLTALKVEFLSFLEEALVHRKQRLGVMHYDDLLLKMERALRSRGGDSLAAAIAGRYRVALIDEFQDTDPLQYEIFTRCFSGSCLFFIGDPKQALYSFRGADVFTYGRAAASVEEACTHTLLHNWRSEPGLIEAVNALFSQAEDPFVFKWIRFHDAEPADKPDRKVLSGLDAAPLQVWYLDADGEKELNVEKAGRAVCRACACEIARLLNLSASHEVKLGSDGIRPSDMAVLVRTNSQARMVRDALRSAGIPCVLSSDENVFNSREAFEMQVLLSALAEPHREGLVRAALMTRLFELDAAAIDALEKDEAAWDNRIGRFRAYHETWSRYGFTPMIRALLDAEGVRARLLVHDQGERALTNILHVAELLGRAEASDKLGVQGLRKWLAERRDPELPDLDEYQLRLESDDDAVKILTVHRSKGLEFAFVFCPFAWGRPGNHKGEGVLFHDDASHAVLDLGSPDREAHLRRAEQEDLAENVRLLYVALTRARNRCYVAWGRVKGADRSALAYLMKDFRDDDLKKALEEFLAKGSGSNLLTDLPGENPAPLSRPAASPGTPAERVFHGTINRTWGMASYTAFIRGMHDLRDAADRDMLAPDAPAGEERKREKDMFSFPRGARSGTLLHEVFERIDFTAGEGEILAVVEQALSGYGFDPAWADPVAVMVKKVLDVDLGGMSLNGIGKGQRLTELEFLFPLRTLTPAALEEALPKTPAPTPRFTFDPVKGFIRGFMDLVFVHADKYYLVDWKSNHLGDSVEDYHSEGLLKVMIRDGYMLQYHLYTVALHRYLAKSLRSYSYREHFGGIIYVFLRGVDPARGPEYGIYRALPREADIRKLDGELSGGGSLPAGQ